MPVIQFFHNGVYRYYKLPEDQLIVFGREDHTDFQLIMDPEISREHFAIEKDEEGNWVLIDLGSKNGTFFNGKKLINETVPLVHGDRIRAGKQHFIFLDKPPKDFGTKVTQKIIDDMAKSIDAGKGFKTMMDEILQQKRKK